MSAPAGPPLFGWLEIVRIGLVQTSLGAIVILMTSTLNRVMIVELGLAASVPGFLVGIHYAVQLSRPRWGYGADIGGSRTPWIIGGMIVLATGALLASVSVALIEARLAGGLILCLLAFILIGGGVGAAGTNLLTLMAVRTAASRKAAAAAIVWIMMIFGFILTAGIGGQLLKPFSFDRLILVTAGVGVIAVILTAAALFRLEKATAGPVPAPEPSQVPEARFGQVLAEIWQERTARRFTIFVFVSMLAYSAQDLILEPFAGMVHGYSAGASTQLAGIQNVGTLIGMIATAVFCSLAGNGRADFLRQWAVGGCLASAASLLVMAAGTMAMGSAWPLIPNVMALGAANGAFAVAAIGTMMTLASDGRGSREGTRMGLWGASQAVAYGAGGLAGAASLDLARWLLDDPASAFAIVFAAEGLLFLLAAVLAASVGASAGTRSQHHVLPARNIIAADGRNRG
ncbi:MAG: BCD family MFS transporter [Hyphomonas sp.]